MTGTERRWSETPVAMLLVVTAAAFVLRLIHILAFSDPALNPAFVAPVTDAGVHHRWAQGLVDGTWPPAAPYFRAPLYPYFLGALYALTGSGHPLAVQLVHGLVSALGAGLTALCACRLWSARAGWAAGLLAATLWSGIYFSGELLAVSLSVTLNLLLLWLLLGPLGASRLVLIGVVLGLSAITRPTVLVIVPAIAWFTWQQGAWQRRGRLPGWLWLGLGLAVAVTPVTVRNIVRGGEPVLIAASGGVNFFIGNNPDSDGRVAYLPGAPPTWQGEMSDAVALASEQAGRPLGTLAADRHFWAQGLAFWRDHPGQAAALTARKLWLLVAAGERSNNKNLAFWRARSPLLRWPVWPGWAVVLGLAVLGFARSDLPPERRRLLLGVILLYSAALLLFFINARFRLPVLAWLVVPAGGGVAALWERWRDRRPLPWSRAWTVAAVAVVGLSFVPDALTYHQDPRTDFESWRSLGNTYLTVGDEERAIAAWEQALAADAVAPREAYRWTLPRLYQPLVQLHRQRRRPDLALAVQRQWARRLPDDDSGRLGLANLLLEQNQPAAALDELQVVLERSPDNTDARLGRAWALQRLERPAAALADFEQVARTSDSPSADLGIGLCLAALERWPEAEARLLALRRARPGLWQLDECLAEVYRATDRPADERVAWQRVLRLQPAHHEARERLEALGR